MKIVNPERDLYKIKFKSKMLKTVTTFVTTGAPSSSLTLSIPGFGLIVIPMSDGIVCGLTLSIK